MFGLTFEKILVITIIAGLVIGPKRLPIYAGKLADFVRDLRTFVESTRARAEDDLGVPLSSSEWMDLRRYDPRRIVRDALEDEPIESGAAQTQQDTTTPPTDPVTPAPAVADAAVPDEAAPVMADASTTADVIAATGGQAARAPVSRDGHYVFVASKGYHDHRPVPGEWRRRLVDRQLAPST